MRWLWPWAFIQIVRIHDKVDTLKLKLLKWCADFKAAKKLYECYFLLFLSEEDFPLDDAESFFNPPIRFSTIFFRSS